MLDQTRSPAHSATVTAPSPKTLGGSARKRPARWRVPGVGPARQRHAPAQTVPTPSSLFLFVTFERTRLVPRPLSKTH